MASGTNDARLEKSLLVLLERAHEVYGYLPEHVLSELAEQLGIPLSHVYGTATFYPHFSTKPLGKHVVSVCKSVPCYLKKNRLVIDAIEKELGVKAGQTTSDSLFSLRLVNCIGACDKAPAMMIDGRIFGGLTPAGVSGILAEYRRV